MRDDDWHPNQDGFARLPPSWQIRIQKLRRDIENYRHQRNELRDVLAAQRATREEEAHDYARQSNLKHGLELGVVIVEAGVDEPRKLAAQLEPHTALDTRGRVVIRAAEGEFLLESVLKGVR